MFGRIKISLVPQIENSYADSMFNETDNKKNIMASCFGAINRVNPDPGDYYKGLPNPTLILPKNILLFSRKRSQAPGFECTHHHHRFLFIASFKGTGTLMINDELIHLTSGHILLIPPYQFHAYNHFETTEIAWLFISFELSDGEALDFSKPCIIKMPIFLTTLLQCIMEDYPDCKAAEKPSAKITLLTATVLGCFHEKLSVSPQKKEPTLESNQELIRSVTSYINDHFSEPIRISDIARNTGHSESSLRAKFRTASGIPLGAYIRRLKIHHARSIMLTTDLTLQEIAERCGYDSIYTFSRTFRNEIGISPSLYRKKAMK
jgi:AraC-like DNA-binding protein/mannose-6-phosphate isomerase-like protein (cupin superfamily)